jgi:hypothetical protein
MYCRGPAAGSSSAGHLPRHPSSPLRQRSLSLNPPFLFPSTIRRSPVPPWPCHRRLSPPVNPSVVQKRKSHLRRSLVYADSPRSRRAQSSWTGLIPSPHVFDVYVSATGNLIDPPHTTGRPLVSLGRIQPDEDGYGDLFREVEGELRDWIGRACVVEAMACVQTSPVKSAAGRIFTGVVARSAGAWGNEKTVCSCSGSTVWEEVRDVAKKGEL